MMEVLFDCGPHKPEGTNQTILAVKADLGDVVRHLVQNTPEDQREAVGQDSNWIILNDTGEIVYFPYVNYVGSPAPTK